MIWSCCNRPRDFRVWLAWTVYSKPWNCSCRSTAVQRIDLQTQFRFSNCICTGYTDRISSFSEILPPVLDVTPLGLEYGGLIAGSCNLFLHLVAGNTRKLNQLHASELEPSLRVTKTLILTRLGQSNTLTPDMTQGSPFTVSSTYSLTQFFNFNMHKIILRPWPRTEFLDWVPFVRYSEILVENHRF